MDSAKPAIVMTIAVFFSLSIIHEETHKVVAESYGCNTNIQYLPDFESGSMMSTTFTCYNLSNQQLDDLRKTQNQVEIFGYTSIFVSSLFTLLLSFIAIELKRIRGIQIQRMEKIGSKKNKGTTIYSK